MYVRWLAGHGLRIIAVPLVLAAVLTGLSPGAASAATCVSWTGVQPSNPGSSANFLHGVAVVSSCRAWAVGYYHNGTAYQTLIEHWNGSSWTQQSSPNPGGPTRDQFLTGATATSASNAWAVGYYSNGTAYQTLIEHWNGTAWKRVSSPSPSSSANALSGVDAASASDAWAVGYYSNGIAYQTLIEHWNGTAWQRLPGPNPSSTLNELRGVAVISARNAWAAGYSNTGSTRQTLIAHWNGTAWTQVPSPNPSSSMNVLYGLAATSASNIWAVGSYYNGTGSQTLALHCC